jgi:hypothetical protein
MNTIAKCVCNALNVDPLLFFERKKGTQDVVYARIIAAVFLKELLKYPQNTDKSIADFLRKNRTAMTHYSKIFKNEIDHNEALKYKFELVANAIYTNETIHILFRNNQLKNGSHNQPETKD